VPDLKFNRTKNLGADTRVTVRLHNGYVGRATVVKHIRHYDAYGRLCGGSLHVSWDDKVRRLRTADDHLATPLDALDLLAELG
jgi:hypothetical protein